MTSLERLRWLLNRGGHSHGIFCSYRKGNYISKGKPIEHEDVSFINKIAESENIKIEIKDNKIYILEVVK